jgi:hypothetical protein
MQRYIEQLIEDIRTAATHAPPDPFDDPDLEKEDMFMLEMEESEKFVEGPYELLCDVVGIPLKALPAPERLSIEQIILLNDELEILLNAYNYYPEYPENVPEVMLYNAYLQVWESEVSRVRFGHFIIGFCDGDDEENCMFPGFCSHCSDDVLLQDEISLNEFDIPARDLSDKENNIEADFDQIKEDFLNNKTFRDDEGFIPGIHNYCDRWCERCDFTDKCRVFEMEKEMRTLFDDKEKGETGDSPEEIADKVRGVFDKDADNDDNGEDFDFDFDFDEEDYEEYQKEQADYFSNRNKVERHSITKLADSYSNESLKWFGKRFIEQEKGFLTQLAGGYSDEIMEAENVLTWYNIFINAKLRRALSNYYELDFDDYAAYDMNGSAKVALIGIDRSIDALSVMIRHVKQHRTELKTFRNQLEEIRSLTEEIFPDARLFIRPGLDEV